MSTQSGMLREMEVFRTEDYYVLLNHESSLWWNRHTGEVQAKPGWELANSGDLQCLGVFYGLVGRIDLQTSFDTRLMLIKEYSLVGELTGRGTVYKIRSVTLLPLRGPDVTNVELGLKPCKKHKNLSPGNISVDTLQKVPFAKTWGTIKSATSTIKNTTQHAAALATSQVKGSNPVRRDMKDKEKYERRVWEELHRIFNDTDSFYFIVNEAGQPADLTNTLQRYCQLERKKLPLRETIEDRFFWNKHMLHEVLQISDPLADAWVLPIIQGFVQIEHCHVEVGFDVIGNSSVTPKYEVFTLSLLSRRSRFRAGTRYKRRGLDETGHCANYVETEQIISHRHHQVAFTQVRGSIPLYWSQPGYKYRPPPRIDKGETETKAAFELHFEEELSKYGPVCIVNLVEQSGKEKVIWDAYTQQVLNYNCPDITYATFDFHEYCRGMRFENVSFLIASLSDVIHDMGFMWRDKQGVICCQTGVFRVNCIDCLDRTNVVQTAVAKAVMELQLTKLGLIPPEGSLPATLRTTFQLLWANNGDIISKQYAGTNALKGDYTRTGERKFTGMMKDGVNSANRYYLSRFKDVYRQATIDVMLGNPLSEEVFNHGDHEEDNLATVDHVKSLIEDCKKMLISDPTMVLGSWGLIDADYVTGDPTETEMDTILILTRDSYYVADYDEHIDRVTKFQCVPLVDLKSVELGIIESTIPMSPSPMHLFKSKTVKGHYCLRLNYCVDGEPGYCHTFRSTNLRFFNNVAVIIKTEEEMIESLRAISEAIEVALDIAGISGVVVLHEEHLEKKTSKPSHGSGTNVLQAPCSSLPRNVSETQLLALKNAGSKALSNVTQQFSKLNRLGHSFSTRRKNSLKQDSIKMEQKVTADQPSFVVGTLGSQVSSEEDEDEDDGDVVTAVTRKGKPVRQKSSEAFLPNVGIVMSNTNIKLPEPSAPASADNTDQLVPNIADVSLNQVE